MKTLKLNSEFNLEHTLFCGQTFRWEKRDGWFYGVIGDGILKLRQQGPIIYYDSSENISKEEIIRYLGLDLDLDLVLHEIDIDKNIHSAINFCKGLRILRQDPWETFATYILSSYNNIPRIRGMAFNISKRFGRRIFLESSEKVSFNADSRGLHADSRGFSNETIRDHPCEIRENPRLEKAFQGSLLNGYTNYTFPAIEKVADARERELRTLGLGFRAEYLKDSAKRILNEGGLFAKLRGLSYEDAKEELLQFEGVGDKVADCIILFGLSRLEAFPVDVWIKRGIERLYFKGKTLSPKRINEFGRKYFGEYAGYAQEYLYHYLRNYCDIAEKRGIQRGKTQNVIETNGLT